MTMTTGWEQLAEYVNADLSDEVALTRYWELAGALVDKYIGTVAVPTVVRDEAVLQVAAELFDRSQTPANAGQMDPNGNVQLRVSRDPMRPAYGLLKRWVVPF